MWNACQNNHLGGKFDKAPGDRREVTRNKEQTFEPVTLEITVFDSKVSFKSIGGQLSSEKDSRIALAIETLIFQHFGTKEKLKTPEVKKLDDGKTIDV